MQRSFTEASRDRIGATVIKSGDPARGGVQFRVWAPSHEKVELVLHGRERSLVPMSKKENGYFETHVPQAGPGTRYSYLLGGKQEVPDPTSRFQPEGPHKPSCVVAVDFAWTDRGWCGLSREELVVYELHVGTFTPEGTFDGVAQKLGHLRDLGVSAIEIMPVAQFPGSRNWGYDGVGLFAAQNSYGGPEGLKRLVNACHEAGIAVILDVVYNHFGPEGNYLSLFGPYFQNKYKTPWGEALNFDGEWSDEVRRFFLENARQWLDEFHIDGLRLDAVHAILDTSAKPFLELLGELKRDIESKTGRRLHLIAESDANDSRLLKSPEQGGLGIDAQWADDLHHEIHCLLTGESSGYYADFGRLDQLAKAFEKGVVFDGAFSGGHHRTRGRSFDGVDRNRLVVCSQNHDQTGNRMMGERLITLAGPDKQRLGAAVVFLSPFLPMVFMGEEIAETAPFLYFIDHTDPDLVKAVQKGRKEEFSAFAWQGEPPDPASPETYLKSKLNWERAEQDELAKSFKTYYRKLIELSKWLRKTRFLEQGHVQAKPIGESKILHVSGNAGGESVHIYFSFESEPKQVHVPMAMARGGGPLEMCFESWDNGAFNESRHMKADAFEMKPFSAVMIRQRRG